VGGSWAQPGERNCRQTRPWSGRARTFLAFPSGVLALKLAVVRRWGCWPPPPSQPVGATYEDASWRSKVISYCSIPLPQAPRKSPRDISSFSLRRLLGTPPWFCSQASLEGQMTVNRMDYDFGREQLTKNRKIVSFLWPVNLCRTRIVLWAAVCYLLFVIESCEKAGISQ